jgi:type II secretory pathway pseudopilin PulG
MSIDIQILGGGLGMFANSKKCGFTLTETCVATLVGALMVVSISKLLTHSVNNSRNASSRLSALHEARTAMEYLHSLDYDDDSLSVGTWTLAADTNSVVVLDVDCNYTVTESGYLKKIVIQVPWTNLFTGVSQVEISSFLSKALHD